MPPSPVRAESFSAPLPPPQGACAKAVTKLSSCSRRDGPLAASPERMDDLATKPDIPQDHKTTADDHRSGDMTDRVSNNIVTIVLATTIPSVVLIILASVLYYRVRRRRSRLFNRGITPIDDEEIASWKSGRADEKAPIPQPHSRAKQCSSHPNHRPANSVASIQKPASVIVYQNPFQYNSRTSEDIPASTAHGKQSADMPRTPVLARAPNARPGLTDKVVQGEDAFISLVKRHPSRLAKHGPPSPRHHRSKSTRATMTGTTGRNLWYGQQFEYHSPPRRSADTFLPTSPTHRSGSNGVYSSQSTPPRTSFDDDLLLGGLSPRPVIHQSEIGRAIG
ncbi:Uncharacterized protein TCAP_05721 [Tolypocladium capitatum]|uniref:Uncharacterized protein n=1 Tax=Tolypocladium capitatum TaxID=45235 RepID=A0A2K3Q9V8_9HYPO|nr:Uncharacterized protein TCAP_05721 [Tolypocladium capitatum]